MDPPPETRAGGASVRKWTSPCAHTACESANAWCRVSRTLPLHAIAKPHKTIGAWTSSASLADPAIFLGLFRILALPKTPNPPRDVPPTPKIRTKSKPFARPFICPSIHVRTCTLNYSVCSRAQRSSGHTPSKLTNGPIAWGAGAPNIARWPVAAGWQLLRTRYGRGRQGDSCGRTAALFRLLQPPGSSAVRASGWASRRLILGPSGPRPHRTSPAGRSTQAGRRLLER